MDYAESHRSCADRQEKYLHDLGRRPNGGGPQRGLASASSHVRGEGKFVLTTEGRRCGGGWGGGGGGWGGGGGLFLARRGVQSARERRSGERIQQLWRENFKFLALRIFGKARGRRREKVP